MCFFSGGTLHMLTGRSIYAWVERLVPYLDGRSDLAQLTANLPAEKAAMVENIVSVMLARGLVRDADRDEPHDLADWELDRYAEEIAYVESFGESAARRFQRFRQSHIVVIGAGRTFVAAVTSVMGAGALRVTAAATAECAADLDSLAEVAKTDGDPAQRLECGPCESEDRIADLVARADVVLQVTDRRMPGRALRLDRLCAEHAKVLVQAVVDGDEAWVGPIADPAMPGSRWESGWRRRHDVGGADLFTDEPDVEPRDYLAGASAALVGNLAGLSAFRQLTGVAADAERYSMTRIDLATLSTSTHRFVPHPLTGPAGETGPDELRAAVSRLRAEPPVDEAELDHRLARLVDDRLGIFGEVSERDFTQLPLCVAAVTVPAAGAGREATGCGLDFRTARLRAAARALELHAVSTVDARRLCRGGTSVWAYDLVDGTARELDPATVFAEPRPVGLAAGYSWVDAVHAGLLDHCRSLSVAEALSGGRGFARIDLAGADLDDDGATYRKLLEIAGVDVEAYDLTGGLRVPTVAVRAGGRTVAYTSALDLGGALRAGLELVLLDHQSRQHGERAYAPPSVSQLPLELPEPVDPHATVPVAGDELAATLAACGHRALAVPLDHDLAATEVLPVVRVVVVDE